MDRCPVCNLRAEISPYPPWLSVTCEQCGAFRITAVAAGVVGLCGVTVRLEVSSRIRRASAGRRRTLVIDLELLETLLRNDGTQSGPPLLLRLAGRLPVAYTSSPLGNVWRAVMT